MPRDATETRARLLREAERLFARHGVWEVKAKDIVVAAGQRNVSALTYHFGSREGLLLAILARHDEAIDRERGRLLGLAGEGAGTRELLTTLLVPYAEPLATPEGRDYLRIVAQLTGEFAGWKQPVEGSGPNLRNILALLEARPPVPPALRVERVLAVIMLMSAAMAERARVLEQRRRPGLDHAAFLANLADELVAIIEAAPGPPLATR